MTPGVSRTSAVPGKRCPSGYGESHCGDRRSDEDSDRAAADRSRWLPNAIAAPPPWRGHPRVTTETYNGYCVKCKEKRDFEGEVAETNGRRMAKGTCPVCGTKMNRILGKA